MTIVLDYVKTLIPVNWKSSPSGWTSGNCPMCIQNGQARPDTKGRGGFFFEEEKFQYNCFNCNYKTGFNIGGKITGRLEKLMRTLGAPENEIQKLKIELLREADVAELLIRKEQKQSLVINWDEISLPENTKPFADYETPQEKFVEAATYLHERGFNPMDNRFMYSTTKAHGRMNNRIVIPFKYKSKVVGYTARWIGTPPDNMPKYYNKQPKKDFVYGLDSQTQDKEIVIVTEGQLDAIITDGVAIGSNNCNNEQANIIDNLNKRVIVLPDADSSGMRLVNAAIKFGWEVSFPEWDDCKDAGDAQMKYGRLFTVKTIIDSAIKNSTKIKIVAKGYCA